MAVLVADVGGTNARLALGRDGRVETKSIKRYRGDDHQSFDDVLGLYLAEQGDPEITAVCIDVAGPVTGGQARLTNRDWDFSEDRLRQLTGAPRARLINDMIALGYSTPALSRDPESFLRQGSGGHDNGQRLVVNAGTGFNVCAVKVLPEGAIACLEAEEGHTRLPQTVLVPLAAALTQAGASPAAIAAFESVEELFAGRGLARLHKALHATPDMRAEDVVSAATTDPRAGATCDLFARLFGLICRELALRYMPLSGMFFAGSVARSVVDRFDIFSDAFLSDSLMARIPQAVPVGVIADDLAALHGCIAAIETGGPAS